MAVAVVAAAGAVVEPVTGSVFAGGALYKKKVDCRAARNKTLANHPMTWLYVGQKRFRML